MSDVGAGQRYRPDIDGLRGIAVAAVVLFHADIRAVSGGFVGVDVFFVISGFLISSQILGLAAAGRFSMREFYERRARRIIPALAAMLLVSSAAACVILSPGPLFRFAQDVVANVVFLPNVDYWRTLGPGYFAPPAADLPLLHTWSLGVEEQFYILFPMCFVWLIQRRAARAPAAIALCLLASFLLCWGVSEAGHPTAAFFSFPTRAWELLLGVAVALVPSGLSEGSVRRAGASVVGMVGLFGSIFYFSSEMHQVGVAVAIPTLSTALLIDANRDARSPIAKVLSFRPLVWLGLISYSFYLWHWPVFVLARQLTTASTVTQTVALITLSVALALASWRFVETPFRRRPSGVPGRIAVWAGAASGMLLLGFAVADHRSVGWPARYSPAARAFLQADDPSPVMRRCASSINTAIPGGTFCRIGARSDADTSSFIVWGDSHARAIIPVLDIVGAEHGLAGYVAAHNACAPLLGVTRIDVDCRPFNDGVIKRIRDQHIRNVVLVARWSLWSVGFRPDVPLNDAARFVLQEAGVSPKTTEENRSAFERTLRKTIASVTATGARVFLVEDVPNYPRNVRLLLANATERGADIGGLGLATDTNRLQHSAEREILQRAADDERVVVVDPTTPLCPGLRCLVAEHGRSFYVDQHHLAEAGALKLAPVIEGMFDAFQH